MAVNKDGVEGFLVVNRHVLRFFLSFDTIYGCFVVSLILVNLKCYNCWSMNVMKLDDEC